jgi:DNA-binding response OmpR family regulator
MILLLEDDEAAVRALQAHFHESLYVCSTIAGFKRLAADLSERQEQASITCIVLDAQLPDGMSYTLPALLTSLGFRCPMLAFSSSEKFQARQMQNGCTHQTGIWGKSAIEQIDSLSRRTGWLNESELL